MESRAKLLGHPIHQMLIVFPLGLLGTAVIFDIIALASHTPEWSTVAHYMIGAGVLSGLLAAIFGLIDWSGIPSGTRAKSIGLWHGGGNVVVTVLFALSWIMRRSAPENPSTTALALSFLGLLLALVTGWLGGELVGRLGVGVAPGAHLNASSSLSGRPASGDKSS
jgi:uncharacterized membrane protein